MNNVSGSGGFYNKLKGPFLSVAMAATALQSSGCNPSQDAIRASHAPIDKFDTHAALTDYLKGLGNFEAKESVLAEVFSRKLKLPKFYTITSRGFYELFNLKDTEGKFVFDKDDQVAISLAVADIQNELEQLENHSLNSKEANEKFYNLVNSRSMKYFCKAWDKQKTNPENPLVDRAVKYFETNFENFPFAANVNLYSAMEKLNELRISGVRLMALKHFTDKALGIQVIPAKQKNEAQERKVDPKPKDFDKTRPIPLAHEVNQVA